MMDAKALQQIFDNEKTNWWYRSLRSKVEILIERIGKPDLRILDAGCGTGYNIIYFSKFGRVIGIDESEEALGLCKKMGITDIKRASLAMLPFSDESFDLILCLDVLCYLDGKGINDALIEMKRVLAHGGSIILNLPAFPILQGAHDEIMGIRKRFRAGELRLLLESKGFKAGKLSYIFSVLFLPLLIRRLFGKLKLAKGSDLLKFPPMLNNMLFFISEIDTQLFRFMDLPFGSSIICLATKDGFSNE